MMFEPQTIDRFLADRWQKKPHFVSGGLDQQLPQLDPDELGWLASQPDVESRLVFTERTDNDIAYRAESGPFDESRLSQLPERDWTLLVQDVEKHLPDFRRYLGEVDFVPDWRIDDLMVSCAAPGGSVGPHVDNYDVFLCQGEGTREWKVGYDEQFERDTANTDLSLIKPYPVAASHRAGSGDVLYLPPGIPHWGVATELCVTYSIGCRAPTRRELELGQERILGKPINDVGGDADQHFYADPDLSVSEAGAGCIDPQTVRRMRTQGILNPSLTDLELARVLGCVVTDPKAWLHPDSVEQEALDRILQESPFVSVHGMARIAWIEIDEHRQVFVNGVDRTINAEELMLVRELCAERQIATSSFAPGMPREGLIGLLTWLSKEGLFDAGHSEE